MKQTWIKLSTLILVVAFLFPLSALAQKEEKEMKEKDEKVKEMKEKKDGEQIVITRKGDKNEKVIVEINGEKITINGKPLEDYKDGDITVHRNKIKDVWAFGGTTPKMNFRNFNSDNNFELFSENSNQAMLGVTTEKVEGGVQIQDITKESAAEKTGLKEKDIITKIDDKKIEDPDDLSSAIKNHKPGDKVIITYLRDKKEQKATAELTKWKGMNFYSTTPGFKMDLGDMNFENLIPRIQGVPRVPRTEGYGDLFNSFSRAPKLGLSVQDTDDGKGVKVIDVDDESNAAKAGIKEEDVITEVDGKAVNGADQMAKIIKESKDKISVMLKLQRSGKTQNIEVKIPRKLKTADL